MKGRSGLFLHISYTTDMIIIMIVGWIVCGLWRR